MTAGPLLITGATGFIGRNLCQHLLACQPEREIFALVTAPTALPERISQIVVGDWSLNGLAEATRGHTFGAIIHLASYDAHPEASDTPMMLATNTVLPNTMVLLARLFGAALISVGSACEYALPRHGRAIDENHPLEATALRGASKAAGWLTASASAVACAVPYAHLRVFDVFGPGEHADNLLPSLAAALDEGRRMPLCDGEQVRDFIHIDDVCKALIAAEKSVTTLGKPQALNERTGSANSVRTFLETACEILGGERYLLGFGDLDRRRGEPAVLIGDPGRAEAVLGVRAQANLKAGLSRSLGRRLEAA